MPAVRNVIASICSFPPVYLAIDSNDIKISYTRIGAELSAVGHPAAVLLQQTSGTLTSL
jgi:hypothetical protein